MIVNNIKFNINPIKFSRAKTLAFGSLKLNPRPERDCFESYSDLSLKDKIRIFKEAGATNDQIQDIIKKPKKIADKIIWSISRQVSVSDALWLSEDKTEYSQRIYILISKGIGFKSARKIAYFDKRTYEKALILTRYSSCIEQEDICTIAKLDDREYLRVIKLIKFGLDAKSAVKLACNKKSYNTVTKLMDKGLRVPEARSISYLSEKEQDIILDLMSKGATLNDAIHCTGSSEAKTSYKEFQSSGFDSETAIILACCDCKRFLNEKEISHLGSTIKTINSQTTKKDAFSIELFYLIHALKDKKEAKDDRFFEKLDNYISSVDFEGLKAHCPKLNNYSNKDLFLLFMWHFKRQQPPDIKAMQFSAKDLTTYLENNYTNAQDGNSLIIAHPLSLRYIGQIPSDWLDKTENKKQAEQKIYKAISKFQKTQDTSAFEEELSEILDKKVTLGNPMPGAYGICRKISIEGAKEYCIKTFKKKRLSYNSRHGAKIEPQAGLFANKHSDKYVKMYFGKICADEKQDAYLVTQYMDDNTTPEISDDIDTSYRIEYLDNNAKNRINGMIVDFGGIKVI